MAAQCEGEGRVKGIYLPAGNRAMPARVVASLHSASHPHNPTLLLCTSPHLIATLQALQVVDLIEAGAVLPPLVVLQALAKDPGVTLGAVRGYVGRQLARETHVSGCGVLERGKETRGGPAEGDQEGTLQVDALGNGYIVSCFVVSPTMHVCPHLLPCASPLW